MNIVSKKLIHNDLFADNRKCPVSDSHNVVPVFQQLTSIHLPVFIFLIQHIINTASFDRPL